MAGNSADAGRSVTSKVIAMLLAFTRTRDLSLSEIARLAGVPISTAHRLVAELVAWGLLERTPDGRYWVGAQLRAIAGEALPLPLSMQERARRVMEDLAAAAICGSVRLGVLRGLQIAYIERNAASRPTSTVFEWVTAPAHATAMGKALLAFSPPELLDRVISQGLLPYTPFTVTSPDRLRRALSVTRLTRVAVARGELEPTRSAVAVPVFGAGGAAVAALELAVRGPQDLCLVQPSLVVAARSLSRELQAEANGVGTSLPPAR